MAKHNVKNPKAIACIALAALGIPALIVLFSLGGVFFAEEHPKVLNYANSMCQVESRNYTIYECKTRAYPYQYTCYSPVWYVHHGEKRDVFATVETNNRYRDSWEALNKAYEYQVGLSYPCWYDLRDPSIAQWDQPNTTVAIILLCFGGLTLLLTILFIFLAVRLIKQEILQNRLNMDAYSYRNSPVNK